MTEFTPLTALIGGLLIGIASVLLLWLNGRVAGISGIMYGVFTRDSLDRNWRLMFVAGLVLGGLAWSLGTGDTFEPRRGFSLPWLIVAGLLVGAGTRLGSGCTSGHGVCGISRLSVRSILSTVTFMASGILCATLFRHWLGVIA